MVYTETASPEVDEFELHRLFADVEGFGELLD
jgi:hypothetical protein